YADTSHIARSPKWFDTFQSSLLIDNISLYSDIPYNDQADALAKNYLNTITLNLLLTTPSKFILHYNNLSIALPLRFFIKTKIDWKATTFCINNNIANSVTSYKISALMKKKLQRLLKMLITVH
ncbi:18634_t:CDS:2, partial [Funneliformis geosporum]